MRTITEHTTIPVNIVNNQLAALFTAEIAKAERMSTSYVRLWQSIEQLVMAGGKRLRPYMTLLGYRAFGGEDDREALPAAVAQELLHAAVLMHDDIIDRDDVRYGVKNVSGQYKDHYMHITDEVERSHYAASAAILGGDLLISTAYRVIAESNIESDKKTRALTQLGESIFAVAGGELLDTEAALLPFDETNATAIAEQKTAGYSFISPLTMGAALAGAPDIALEKLRIFGRDLGIAYQFTDDLLGIFGDEATTGKTNTGDIREGKHTFLIEAYRQFGADETLFARTFGKSDAISADIDALKEHIAASGASEHVQTVVDEYAASARQALASLELEPEYQMAFEALITKATKRAA